jgi:hypothetical protein
LEALLQLVISIIFYFLWATCGTLIGYMCEVMRHCGVDAQDLCLAVIVNSLTLDIAEVLVTHEFVKVGWLATGALGDGFLVGCLCWLDLVFAVGLLPLNIGEASLRDEVLAVVGGCYETSCDTLPQPLKLVCIVVVVAVHDSVAAVHHSVVECVLTFWALILLR